METISNPSIIFLNSSVQFEFNKIVEELICG